MTTTVSQLQNAIKNGGPWPFNQYGSFWAFVYAIPTWSIQFEYLLISMRLLTIVFYFLTAWLIYKIGRLFVDPVFAILGVMLLLGNQPFLFDLLPWPSAVSMPIITLVSFLLFRKVANSETIHRRGGLEVSVIGALIPMVILSRVQIGIILLVISFCFLYAFGNKHELVFFILSFLTTIGIFFWYLASKGWLIPSLKDQFLFGSTYVKSGANPIPIFTSIGVLIVLLFFTNYIKVFEKISKINDKRKVIVLLAFTFLVFLVPAVLFLTKRDMNFYSIYLLIIHRFWISIILGGVIYFATVQVKKSYTTWKNQDVFNRELHLRNLLALLSITSQLQVYPLFDQMHSWWGSTPGVIVLVVILKEKFEILSRSTFKSRNLVASMVTATLLLSAIPFAIQIWNLDKQVSSQYLGAIRVSEKTAEEILILQKAFEENLVPGTKVLNICADPDVFLNAKFSLSESRVFVFWPEFLKSNYLRETFQETNAQHIVSCFSQSDKNVDLNTFQEFVNQKSSNYILLFSARNLLGNDWQVWKK